MTKKRLTIGILAHVDAGKTTLSEAMLVASGVLAKAGRVDSGSSFLDTDEQERARGITIFSGQARMEMGNTELTLVDTPGHVDFSAEMERALSILDAAVLVISGRQLVQGHTVTIWKLLQKLAIPVFIFVNKMDLEGTDPRAAMDALRSSLDEGCVMFGNAEGGSASGGRTAILPDPEELAMCDEALMDLYLAEEDISDEAIASAVARRRVFPCWFGSALYEKGVEDLLEGLDRFTRRPVYGREFAARVFRITRDEKGVRQTHMKITGGTLSVKDSIQTSEGADDLEKVHQIRLYSGSRYETVETAEAGQLAAVVGLENTRAGQGMGTLLGQISQAQLQPVLVYRLLLPEKANLPLIMQQMRQLEEEDPQLNVRWSEQKQEIQVRLMGEIQLEILTRLITDRFGFVPRFDEGSIEYRETIANPVRGAGHFEPLRHYAEVHLLLEPLPEGSGIQCHSSCSSDVLDTNWQRLIMTHLTEREHPGVLMGAPLTDVKITIEGGRAHIKHTEGGDFRQATYRALRQAMRKAAASGDAVLLEPWYDFLLELPRDQAGRAMSDIRRMGGSFEIAERQGAGGETDSQILQGRAPVREMRGYAAEVASYTKGYGHLSCAFSGYSACHNAEEAIRAAGYDPDRDMDNPADSVFCSHGAGYMVAWDQADEMMHVQIRDGRSVFPEDADDKNGGPGPKMTGAGSSDAGDKDLQRIFERTYGKKDAPKVRKPARIIQAAPQQRQKTKPAEILPEYLLVDGYNIIFAWDELRELSKISIDAAREALIDILSNYQGYRQCRTMVVFDAYRVKGGREHTEKQGGVTVVFTAEAETADTYIERTTYEMKKQKYRVRVATSDRLEQMIILGNDAFRVSATEFQAEVSQINDQIREILESHRRQSDREGGNRIILPQE